MILRREDSTRQWTVADLLRWTEGHFEQLGLPAPRLDAEVLLAKAIGRTRLELYTGYQMVVEPEERSRFRGFVERRSRREPVAYITEEREFFSLRFEVSPAVLVPRPETEHLVEAALRELQGVEGPAMVLDLGTGSGNVAVAIAVNAPHSRVDAVDSSPTALAIAARNASAHGVSDRVRFLAGDLFAALPEDAGPYRAIVSNPPYISAAAYDALLADVRFYEPREALLDSKSPAADGLGFYRALTAGAPRCLEEGGILALEIGEGQAVPVGDILAANGWVLDGITRDYGGIERVVVARRQDP